MTVTDKELAAAPFNLDKAAIDWVWSTFAGLSETEKLGQIVLPLCRDLAPDMLDAMLAHGVGGLHRMPSRSVSELRQSATYVQARSRRAAADDGRYRVLRKIKLLPTGPISQIRWRSVPPAIRTLPVAWAPSPHGKAAIAAST